MDVRRVSFECKSSILSVSRGHLVGVKNESCGCRNIPLLECHLSTSP